MTNDKKGTDLTEYNAEEQKPQGSGVREEGLLRIVIEWSRLIFLIGTDQINEIYNTIIIATPPATSLNLRKSSASRRHPFRRTERVKSRGEKREREGGK